MSFRYGRPTIRTEPPWAQAILGPLARGSWAAGEFFPSEQSQEPETGEFFPTMVLGNWGISPIVKKRRDKGGIEMILHDNGKNYRFDPGESIILLEVDRDGDRFQVYHHPRHGWLVRAVRSDGVPSIVWRKLKPHSLGTGYRCVWSSNLLTCLGQLGKARHYIYRDHVISVSGTGTHIWSSREFVTSQEFTDLLDRGEYDQEAVLALERLLSDEVEVMVDDHTH